MNNDLTAAPIESTEQQAFDAAEVMRELAAIELDVVAGGTGAVVWI